MLAHEFITSEESTMIICAVHDIMEKTSGEIRIKINKTLGEDALTTARAHFVELGMRNNKKHNGVLIVIAIETKQFIIFADSGIDKKVSHRFWENNCRTLEQYFQQQQIAEGLLKIIHNIGEQLIKFYPANRTIISYGEETV